MEDIIPYIGTLQRKNDHAVVVRQLHDNYLHYCDAD